MQKPPCHRGATASRYTDVSIPWFVRINALPGITMRLPTHPVKITLSFFRPQVDPKIPRLLLICNAWSRYVCHGSQIARMHRERISKRRNEGTAGVFANVKRKSVAVCGKFSRLVGYSRSSFWRTVSPSARPLQHVRKEIHAASMSRLISLLRRANLYAHKSRSHVNGTRNVPTARSCTQASARAYTYVPVDCFTGTRARLAAPCKYDRND